MKSIRVIIQQPALPKFRVSLFKELASRPDIFLKLYYSTLDPSLPNVEADGFLATHVPIRKINSFSNHQLLWHSPQWDYASRTYCDVLLLSWDLHYLSLIPSLIKARINHVPVILWGHGYSKQENAIRFFSRKSVAKLASALIFYDFNTAKTYIKSGYSSEKIYVAPNSLDQTTIKNAKFFWLNNPERLSQFRKENNLDPGPNIIFIGRIYEKNRLDILIQALPRIFQDYPSSKLVVIGQGTDELNRLKELSKYLGVEKKIIWTGAIYEEEQIAPWMLSSKIFCHPAYMGLSIMHAFGYGLPVVAGNNIMGHGPEVYALKNGQNGKFFQQNSPQELAKVICGLLKDTGKLAFMTREATKTVEQDYNIFKMVDGFEAAIHYVNQFYNT